LIDAWRLVFLVDVGNLEEESVQGLRFGKEGAMVAASQGEHAFRGILLDDCVLGGERQGLVDRGGDEESPHLAVVRLRQEELLHGRGERRCSHRVRCQGHVLHAKDCHDWKMNQNKFLETEQKHTTLVYPITESAKISVTVKKTKRKWWKLVHCSITPACTLI